MHVYDQLLLVVESSTYTQYTGIMYDINDPLWAMPFDEYGWTHNKAIHYVQKHWRMHAKTKLISGSKLERAFIENLILI